MVKGKLSTRLRVLGLLMLPLGAVQIAPILKAIRPASAPLGSAWTNGGLIAGVLYVFLSPLVLQWLLGRSPQSREVLERRGTTGPDLVLLVAVSVSAAGSMVPVIIMWLGGDSGSFIVPWATVCVLHAIFWCWRYRHLLT
jgi:hypothetical protein